MATKPEVSAGPPPAAVSHDPLPDTNWFFRRMFTFGVTIVLLAMVFIKIDLVAQVALKGSNLGTKGLIQIIKQDQFLIGVLILFYMVAPSAEQIVKMIQTASLLRGGSLITRTSAVAADGASAQATTIMKSNAGQGNDSADDAGNGAGDASNGDGDHGDDHGDDHGAGDGGDQGDQDAAPTNK